MGFPNVFKAGPESFSFQLWGDGGALAGLEELVAHAGRLQPPSGSNQDSKEAEMGQFTPKKKAIFRLCVELQRMMGSRARLSTGEVLSLQPGRSPPGTARLLGPSPGLKDSTSM